MERGLYIMQAANLPIMEKEFNGCRVTLIFTEKPVEGVVEGIQSILSNAYDERVQNDLAQLAGH